MPKGRSGQSMTYYPEGHKILIFGGRSSKSADSDMNDLWSFDIRTKFWQRINENERVSDKGEKTSLKNVLTMVSVLSRMKPQS